MQFIKSMNNEDDIVTVGFVKGTDSSYAGVFYQPFNWAIR